MNLPNYKRIYTKKYFEERPDLNDQANRGHFCGYAQWISAYLDFKTVFDVGVGYGWLIKHLHNLGHEASGCDISSYIVSLISTEDSGVNLYVDELPELKNTDDSFDLVISYHVLEHLTPEDVKKSIDTMIEVSDKYVLIVVPMKDVGDRGGESESTHLVCEDRKWWESQFDGIKGKLLPLRYAEENDCSIIFQKEYL